MGGNSQPATTTQINKTELPAWVDAASQENYAFAKDVANRPFEQYEGQRVADQSPYTKQAYDLVQKNVGSLNPYIDRATGAFDTAQSLYGDMVRTLDQTKPLYDRATGAFDQASATLDATKPLHSEAADLFRKGTGALDIQGFLNPYTAEVEKNAISNAERSLSGQLLANRDQARKSGAFGGSRGAIQDAVTQAEGARGIGDLSAQLRKAGFDTATANAFQDREKYGKAAAGLLGTASGMQGTAQGQLGVGQGHLGTASGIRDTASGYGQAGAGFGNTGSGFLNAAQSKLAGNVTDAQSLLGIGQQDQAHNQANINSDMAKWGEKWNYPVEQLNTKLAALGMSPYGKTETINKTSTSEKSGPDFATMGLGIMQMLPMLFMMSDRNTKTDIKKLTDGDIPMYSYRYKGDPKSYPKVVGPMAQDIEKKYPSAVKKLGKHKVVDMSNLMEVLS